MNLLKIVKIAGGSLFSMALAEGLGLSYGERQSPSGSFGRDVSGRRTGRLLQHGK